MKNQTVVDVKNKRPLKVQKFNKRPGAYSKHYGCKIMTPDALTLFFTPSPVSG